jgi:hypothetical protein
LFLQPILAADKIQWDLATKRLKPLDPQEENAFLRLQEVARNASDPIQATVTGPLRKRASGYVLEVREFSVYSAPFTYMRA